MPAFNQVACRKTQLCGIPQSQHTLRANEVVRLLSHTLVRLVSLRKHITGAMSPSCRKLTTGAVGRSACHSDVLQSGHGHQPERRHLTEVHTSLLQLHPQQPHRQAPLGRGHLPERHHEIVDGSPHKPAAVAPAAAKQAGRGAGLGMASEQATP
eukprot:363592-Chlamydomonas_euryale.AAC.5